MMSDEKTTTPGSERWAWARRLTARDLAPVASLLVLVVFFALATNSFLRLTTIEHVLRQGSALAIVAVGLTFVLLCAEIDLSVAQVALWTACLCGWMFERFSEAGDAGVGVVAMVILVPLATSLMLGVASGVLTVWSNLPSFIITLAMMKIADGAARYLTESQKMDVPDVLKTVGNRGWDLGGGSFTIPYGAMVAAVVFALAYVVLGHTRFGRYVYMTGGNREAARLAGVRTPGIVVGCLAISAVLAGVGGLVNAGRLQSVTLDQNADLLLEAVACVVLGGTSLFGGEGGIGKTLVGVLTFCVLKVGLNQITWIDDMARPLLMGAVLMTALVVNGLLAKRS